MKRILQISLFSLLCLPTVAQTEHNFEVSKYLDIFNSLYRDLDLYYVDTLNAKENVGNALLYMLDQLDPYTAYYSPDQKADLEQLTTGKYAGIGSPIRYKKSEKRCVFDGPYGGMPAQQAGVRSGDVILRINGKDVGTAEPSEQNTYTTGITRQLRGDAGTTFELTVKRPGHAKPISMKITRANIERPVLELSKMLNDSVGYIALSGFTENTSRNVRMALAELKKQGAKNLVLDLRNNPGGLLTEAVNLVNLFIPKNKEVVSTRGKTKEATRIYKTQEEPFDLQIPIVVLVNNNTASSAEITSGALQDYDRAVIVGLRTYGKGLVQQTRPLPYDAAFKLTTSKYFIPSGRCIQAYDFKNRNEDGMPSHLPDSLCKTFYTTTGRPVKDGGGITPDIAVKLDSMSNIQRYLITSDVLFDFCVDFYQHHPTIAPPSVFKLSDADFERFVEWVKKSDFTYDVQSQRVLKLLREVAAAEGYSDEVNDELKAIEEKMKPNLERDLRHWRSDITKIIETEIVNNFYHEQGLAEYSLRQNPYIEKALEILGNTEEYHRILKK